MSRDYGKKCNTPAKKMADGGGVGTWERIKAGNIDEAGSEANVRWGSGSKAPAPADDSDVKSSNMSSADDNPAYEAPDKAPEPEYGNEHRRTQAEPAKPAKSAPKKKAAPKVTPLKSVGLGKRTGPGEDYGNEGYKSKPVGNQKRKFMRGDGIDPKTLLPKK